MAKYKKNNLPKNVVQIKLKKKSKCRRSRRFDTKLRVPYKTPSTNSSHWRTVTFQLVHGRLFYSVDITPRSVQLLHVARSLLRGWLRTGRLATLAPRPSRCPLSVPIRREVLNCIETVRPLHRHNNSIASRCVPKLRPISPSIITLIN